ncbi:MAG: proline/glycine betaine ABC transporter permease [Methylophilales bacterium]|nr:proline/glycine betaine ABC transporter permease [Methylophilales bacterium]
MSYKIPLGEWVAGGVKWLENNDHGAFNQIGSVIDNTTSAIEHGLIATPYWLFAAIFIGIAYWRRGWQFATFCAASLWLISNMGFVEQTLVTLALITSATLISLTLGIPLGIWAGRSDRAESVIRPTLDFMQTMPAFVYLIPAAMFFGLGRVPGVIATVIFAMPPVVRLTSLGIRQVNKEQVEAGIAFGCTPSQLLLKVQLPSAMAALFAGINQTIMMALSMVIIASMVGAGGLGNDVLSSISRLDIGLGFESGLGVVLLAIMLDRITESFGVKKAVR